MLQVESPVELRSVSTATLTAGRFGNIPVFPDSFQLFRFEACFHHHRWLISCYCSHQNKSTQHVLTDVCLPVGFFWPLVPAAACCSAADRLALLQTNKNPPSLLVGRKGEEKHPLF